MNITLTGRALAWVRARISESPPEQVPAFVWATAVSGPTRWFWGLFRTGKAISRTGWFLFFYGPEQRPKDWVEEIAGTQISISPEMRTRLEGRTLDVVEGQLQEI